MHPMIVAILVMTVGLLIGRRAGWLYSRGFLYPLPTALAALLSVFWACGIAYLARLLIQRQHMGIIYQVIIYGASAYISVPNYGLFAEGTIPVDIQAKHRIISVLPLLTFVVASVTFVFFIRS